jgi:hypothetical protein
VRKKHGVPRAQAEELLGHIFHASYADMVEASFLDYEYGHWYPQQTSG